MARYSILGGQKELKSSRISPCLKWNDFIKTEVQTPQADDYSYKRLSSSFVLINEKDYPCLSFNKLDAMRKKTHSTRF